MIAQITTHVADAIARLPEQHKQPLTEKIQALVSIYAARMQTLENVLFQILLGRFPFIDTAIGEQLDQIGRLVLLDRNGLSDTEYRIRLRARLLVLRSRGTTEDIIGVVKALILDGAPDATVEVQNEYPASVVVRLLGDDVSDALADVIISFLRKTKSGGVRIIEESSGEAPADWLQLDVDTLDDHSFMDARD
jgi:hypothetical protein